MEINEKYSNLCRTCLKKTSKLSSVFDNVDVWELNIAEILKECTSVEISTDDSLPKVICDACIQQVKYSFKFKRQCELSQQTLRFLLEDIDAKNPNNDNLNDVTNFWEDKNIVLKEEENDTEIINETTYDEYLYLDDSKVSIEIKETTSDLEEKPFKVLAPLQNNKIKVYTCLVCSNKFSSKTSYDYHKRHAHTERKYKCDTCDKTFIMAHTLQTHMLTHGYHCRTCFTSFNSNEELIKHQIEHQDQVGFVCKDCGKHFIRKAKLKLHLRTHTGEKPHLCTVCGKAFALRGNLNTHMRIHTGIKPYTCKLCDESFVQWYSLRSHLITHAQEKMYVCPECGKSFARQSSLKQHSVCHTNERKYACQVCDKRFKNSRDRNLHMVVHTGERKHSCEFCGKSFNRASNLKVHLRIHTGEKPHTCNICGRGFIQHHVLINHLKTHQIK